MKTSLKDIAETLKLSKTTISWVLSGKGDEKGISLATQEKVFQCATQLGNCLLKLFVDLFLRNAKLFGNLLRLNTDRIHFGVKCLSPGCVRFTAFCHQPRFA